MICVLCNIYKKFEFYCLYNTKILNMSLKHPYLDNYLRHFEIYDKTIALQIKHEKCNILYYSEIKDQSIESIHHNIEMCDYIHISDKNDYDDLINKNNEIIKKRKLIIYDHNNEFIKIYNSATVIIIYLFIFTNSKKIIIPNITKNIFFSDTSQIKIKTKYLNYLPSSIIIVESSTRDRDLDKNITNNFPNKLKIINIDAYQFEISNYRKKTKFPKNVYFIIHRTIINDLLNDTMFMNYILKFNKTLGTLFQYEDNLSYYHKSM